MQVKEADLHGSTSGEDLKLNTPVLILPYQILLCSLSCMTVASVASCLSMTCQSLQLFVQYKTRQKASWLSASMSRFRCYAADISFCDRL